jgi:hypothetical protein
MKTLNDLTKEQQMNLNNAIKNDDIGSFRNIIGYNSMDNPEQLIWMHYYNHMRSSSSNIDENIDSRQKLINTLVNTGNEIVDRESNFNNEGNYVSYERISCDSKAVNLLVNAAKDITRGKK